jgi:cytochrome c oxidase assembly protein subunit 15
MKMSGYEHAVVGFITLGIIVLAAWWVGRDMQRYRRLIAATTVATFFLVVLGAFVRLSDAGLGCPDWPGCYGNLTPHHSTEAIRAAEAVQPGGPVSMAKAWKEMLHRYLAMVVGALIAAILIAAWRQRAALKQSPFHAAVLAGAVIFQAALGAWTVTMLLKPAIVTSHLLGGITILVLLSLLWARQLRASAYGANWARDIMASRSLRMFAWIVLALLLGQVTLGGWTSTNYAALACTDLPTCHGQWVPAMDFVNAFHVIRPLGVGPDGELLTIDALRAIHWMHRLGAVIVCICAGIFVWRLLAVPSAKAAAKMLLGLLSLQVLLGLSNVWFSLPLLVAVLHNGIAALLVAWMALIVYRMYPAPK